MNDTRMSPSCCLKCPNVSPLCPEVRSAYREGALKDSRRESNCISPPKGNKYSVCSSCTYKGKFYGLSGSCKSMKLDGRKCESEKCLRDANFMLERLTSGCRSWGEPNWIRGARKRQHCRGGIQDYLEWIDEFQKRRKIVEECDAIKDAVIAEMLSHIQSLIDRQGLVRCRSVCCNERHVRSTLQSPHFDKSFSKDLNPIGSGLKMDDIKTPKLLAAANFGVGHHNKSDAQCSFETPADGENQQSALMLFGYDDDGEGDGDVAVNEESSPRRRTVDTASSGACGRCGKENSDPLEKLFTEMSLVVSPVGRRRGTGYRVRGGRRRGNVSVRHYECVGVSGVSRSTEEVVGNDSNGTKFGRHRCSGSCDDVVALCERNGNRAKSYHEGNRAKSYHEGNCESLNEVNTPSHHKGSEASPKTITSSMLHSELNLSCQRESQIIKDKTSLRASDVEDSSEEANNECSISYTHIEAGSDWCHNVDGTNNEEGHSTTDCRNETRELYPFEMSNVAQLILPDPQPTADLSLMGSQEVKCEAQIPTHIHVVKGSDLSQVCARPNRKKRRTETCSDNKGKAQEDGEKPNKDGEKPNKDGEKQKGSCDVTFDDSGVLTTVPKDVLSGEMNAEDKTGKSASLYVLRRTEKTKDLLSSGAYLLLSDCNSDILELQGQQIIEAPYNQNAKTKCSADEARRQRESIDKAYGSSSKQQIGISESASVYGSEEMTYDKENGTWQDNFGCKASELRPVKSGDAYQPGSPSPLLVSVSTGKQRSPIEILTSSESVSQEREMAYAESYSKTDQQKGEEDCTASVTSNKVSGAKEPLVMELSNNEVTGKVKKKKQQWIIPSKKRLQSSALNSTNSKLEIHSQDSHSVDFRMPLDAESKISPEAVNQPKEQGRSSASSRQTSSLLRNKDASSASICESPPPTAMEAVSKTGKHRQDKYTGFRTTSKCHRKISARSSDGWLSQSLSPRALRKQAAGGIKEQTDNGAVVRCCNSSPSHTEKAVEIESAENGFQGLPTEEGGKNRRDESNESHATRTAEGDNCSENRNGHDGKSNEVKYFSVVRKAKDREGLQGVDCSQCAAWYKATADCVQGDGAAHFCDDKKKLVQETSRHRYKYIAPPTPPRFWQISFPSTLQHCDDYFN